MHLNFLPDIEVSGGVISVRRDIGWCCLLGEYSTKEKAMKVLDMIQEAYSEYQIMLNFSVSYLHEFKEKQMDLLSFRCQRIVRWEHER